MLATFGYLWPHIWVEDRPSAESEPDSPLCPLNWTFSWCAVVIRTSSEGKFGAKVKRKWCDVASPTTRVDQGPDILWSLVTSDVRWVLWEDELSGVSPVKRWSTRARVRISRALLRACNNCEWLAKDTDYTDKSVCKPALNIWWQ